MLQTVYVGFHLYSATQPCATKESRVVSLIRVAG